MSEPIDLIFSTHDAKVIRPPTAVVRLADGKIVARESPERAAQALGGGP